MNTCFGYNLELKRKVLKYGKARSIANLSDLSAELYERPALASILGFEPGDRPIPVKSFSCFLKDTDNKILQEVRVSLIKKLIGFGIIKGKYLSVDSCPIFANVKSQEKLAHLKF